jgi:acetoin utilization deacetylase AcuC-like enzyme/ribosomal protein S18 acetylase RimI-like enzyme
MFRIRKVPDDSTPGNAEALSQVQAIWRARFPLVAEEDIASLPEKLRDPLKYRFRSVLLVAENARHRVQGFALLLHAPDVRFCYLDFIAIALDRPGRGIGGALYERVREEALALGAVGVFLECLPDDPALSPDPVLRAENAERLKFYERYGARPVAGTQYETPLTPGDTDPPYLILDPLGREVLPSRDQARAIVGAILERKYGKLCPPAYRRMVVESFVDDPIRLRPQRYVRRLSPKAVPVAPGQAGQFPLVINDKHDIHHVHERGYVEAPVRIGAILKELDRSDLFRRVEPRHFPDTHILAVHDGRLVDYLRRACAQVGTGRSVYPYVFPIRNEARPPKDLPVRAGYFCIDTFTPINGNAYLAARRAVDCALTAAEQVLQGARLAYALVRPPGHHAERYDFGGFCYFNNAAIAAHYLSRYGRVAVLDVDYHHGNGTQQIFYERSDVLTVSIHGHPSFAYPYFSGFKDEQGTGPGLGYNLNIPLPEQSPPDAYRQALERALGRIRRFGPAFLLVAAGFDTASGDPTGTWANRGEDFLRMGESIGHLGLPTLVVQESGYRVRTLGANARRFFEGLRQGLAVPVASPGKARRPKPPAVPMSLTRWREDPLPSDREAVRSLVAAAGVFSTQEATIAAELVEERLARGTDCGYWLIFAELGERLAGYSCYGPIPGTEGRFDLYWIAVRPEHRRSGIGRELLRRTEEGIKAHGGRRLYIDTSASEQYEAARRFYRASGYRKVAELPDFFRDGDGKVIYAKALTGSADECSPA